MLDPCTLDVWQAVCLPSRALARPQVRARHRPRATRTSNHARTHAHTRRDGVPLTTGRLPLSNSKNNFERAMVDVFTSTALNVGDISHIVIGHDNAQAGADWHLNNVRVFVCLLCCWGSMHASLLVALATRVLGCAGSKIRPCFGRCTGRTARTSHQHTHPLLSAACRWRCSTSTPCSTASSTTTTGWPRTPRPTSWRCVCYCVYARPLPHTPLHPPPHLHTLTHVT